MNRIIEIKCDSDNRCLESNVSMEYVGFNELRYLAASTISKEEVAKLVDELYISHLLKDDEKQNEVFLKIFHVRRGIENDGIFIHMSSLEDIHEFWDVYQKLEKRTYRLNQATGELHTVMGKSRKIEEILPGVAFEEPKDSVIIYLRGEKSFMYTRNYNRILLFVFDGNLLQRVIDSCN